MADYLKLFKNLNEFENSENKLIKNHLIDDVELREDPYRGHAYVEIGGFKWATMNIGAENITDNGLYFAWGETKGYTVEQVGRGEGKKYFDWSDYELAEGTYRTIKRYFRNGETLQPEDDAAVVNWGGIWRMPTRSECAALDEATDVSYVSNYKDSGVAGYVLTDKTDSSKELFFPAAGWCTNGTVSMIGSYGLYWSNTLDSDNYGRNATMMQLTQYSQHFNDFNSRMQGLSVRAVAEW